MNPNRIPLRYTLEREGLQLNLTLRIADGIRLALHNKEQDMSSFGGLMDGKHYPVRVERSPVDGIYFISNYLNLSASPVKSGTDLSASLEVSADKIDKFETDVRCALDLFNENYRSYGY